MQTYIILLRGINVGGKNKVSMTELKQLLEQDGCKQVTPYINSGNIIVTSDSTAKDLAENIEDLLPKHFKLDSSIIKVLVLSKTRLRKIVEDKPKEFGDEPNTYHSDVIFLMNIDETEALSVFSPRDGVDKIWQANGVIYSQRVSTLRTKSRLNKIISSPLYKSMTIRSWNTTTKLLKLTEEK